MKEKIAIALPHFGQMMYSETALSLMRVIGQTIAQRPSAYTLLKPAYPSQAEAEKRCITEIRNNLVEQALDEVCTKIIMLDTDQTYPPDTIINLLSHDKAIVTGQVHRRYPPFDPIMLRGTLHKYLNVPYEEMYTGEIVEIDATGAACMCVDMSVFLDVQYPWFEEIPQTEDEKPVGEDIHFWHKVKEAGYQIFMDTSIQIGHLGLRTFGRGDYVLYRKVVEKKG